MVIKTDECNTGFSIILTSFEGDRTVLAHRGTNGKIRCEEIPWEEIKKAKWLYIAPLSKESNFILDKLAEFAEEHNVNMAFNPGGSSIKRGIDGLKKIFSTAEVLIMNKEEASKALQQCEKPRTKHDETPEFKKDTNIPTHVEKLLCSLKSYNPKIVVITDGKNGVYAFDGEYYYQADIFPSKVISSLGAGDAFASTFVATLMRTDWNIEKALRFASINSAYVVKTFGAQQGLISYEKIEEILEQSQTFKVNKFKKDLF